MSIYFVMGCFDFAKIKTNILIAIIVASLFVCEITFGSGSVKSVVIIPGVNTSIASNTNEYTVANDLLAMNMLLNQNANKKEVYGLSIESLPTKINYVVGEYLDLTGLMIKVIYSDSTSEYIVFNEMSRQLLQISPSLFMPLTANDTYVTITYNGVSTICPIIVAPDISLIQNTLISNGTSDGNNAARTGRVLDRDKSINATNDDTLNFLLQLMLAQNMNNANVIMPTIPTTPIIPTVPVIPAVPQYNNQWQQNYNPYNQNYSQVQPSVSSYVVNNRPAAVSQYMVENPQLTYKYNTVDNSYTFSNGMTVYPSGMMIDAAGNTYLTDGSTTRNDGLTQYANGSIKDASGNIYNLDGTISLPGNAYVDTNGLTHYNDGSIKLADGTVYNTDGSINFTDGTVVTGSGRVIRRTRKAVETEEKEKNKDAWRYDPISNEWRLEGKDQVTSYFK